MMDKIVIRKDEGKLMLPCIVCDAKGWVAKEFPYPGQFGFMNQNMIVCVPCEDCSGMGYKDE